MLLTIIIGGLVFILGLRALEAMVLIGTKPTYIERPVVTGPCTHDRGAIPEENYE